MPEPAPDDARDADEDLHRRLGDASAPRLGAISDMKSASPTDSGVEMSDGDGHHADACPR